MYVCIHGCMHACAHVCVCVYVCSVCVCVCVCVCLCVRTCVRVDTSPVPETIYRESYLFPPTFCQSRDIVFMHKPYICVHVYRHKQTRMCIYQICHLYVGFPDVFQVHQGSRNNTNYLLVLNHCCPTIILPKYMSCVQCMVYGTFHFKDHLPLY